MNNKKHVNTFHRISLFAIFLYLSSSAVAQDTDSIVFSKTLQEVVIKADLYIISSDALIYNVAADISLAGKTSFEALRNTPMLIVERNGTVRSVGDRPIEYMLNGLHDNSLSGNIQDATESLDAKYVKRIEVRIMHNMDGSEKLQVNIVTKGHLVGYRGVASSTLSDENWSNGAYAFLKTGRWGISTSYYNTWKWGHNSRSSSEEYRYAQQDLNHIFRNSKNGGYKVDLNNFEANLNYEINPLSVFSIFGRALLKANPRQFSNSECEALDNLAATTYRYNQDRRYDVQKDAEYEFSMGYENLFGEQAEHGKFYAGYQFYRRPVKTNTEEQYTDLESKSPDYVEDFFNTEEAFEKIENWHTGNILYRRKMHGHEFYAEEYARYRDESEDVDQRQTYDYATTPYTTLYATDFTHRQFANMLQAGYGYTGGKVDFRIGGTFTYLHDYIRHSEQQDSYTTNQRYVTPYANMSYVPARGINLRLSYTMNKQIPDVEALNPYVYTNVQGQITYGNPDLKPQTSHAVALSSTMRVGKVNLYAALTNSFSDDLILQHSFLKDGLLNITRDNMGRRYEMRLQTNASSKFTKTTWGRIETNLFYTDYAATSEYKRNHGCTFSANTSIEQELPKNFDISVNVGYNSKWIYLQGNGGENYYYSLRIDKSFPRQRITIGAEARSFIPIHYTDINERRSDGYYSITRDRSYHANFSLSFRWRFGKLKADIRKVEEKIGHDDIKQSYDE